MSQFEFESNFNEYTAKEKFLTALLERIRKTTHEESLNVCITNTDNTRTFFNHVCSTYKQLILLKKDQEWPPKLTDDNKYINSKTKKAELITPPNSFSHFYNITDTFNGFNPIQRTRVGFNREPTDVELENDLVNAKVLTITVPSSREAFVKIANDSIININKFFGAYIKLFNTFLTVNGKLDDPEYEKLNNILEEINSTSLITIKILDSQTESLILPDIPVVVTHGGAFQKEEEQEQEEGQETVLKALQKKAAQIEQQQKIVKRKGAQ